jgi:hypothetical protein
VLAPTCRHCSRPLDRRARLAFRTRILLAFVAVQLCDAAFTYAGVRAFGAHIEANPIVAWYIATFGLTTGLLTTKGLAIGCAGILFLLGRHGTVALLTLVYFVVALWPWAGLFAMTHF